MGEGVIAAALELVIEIVSLQQFDIALDLVEVVDIGLLSYGGISCVGWLLNSCRGDEGTRDASSTLYTVPHCLKLLFICQLIFS